MINLITGYNNYYPPSTIIIINFENVWRALTTEVVITGAGHLQVQKLQQFALGVTN